MPCCSAVNCHNSGNKGFSMRAFPRDPARRSLWASKLNRSNWNPSNSSRICEVHFDGNQWEKPRMDGKKKLKHNAVPTIFDHMKPIKKRKPKIRALPAKRKKSRPTDNVTQPLVSNDHQYSSVSKPSVLIRTPPKRKQSIIRPLLSNKKMRRTDKVDQPLTFSIVQYSSVSETDVLIATPKKWKLPIQTPPAKETNTSSNSEVTSTSYDHEYSSASKTDVLLRSPKSRKPATILTSFAKEGNTSRTDKARQAKTSRDHCSSVSETDMLIRTLQQKLEKIEKVVEKQHKEILHLRGRLRIHTTTRNGKKKGR